MTQYLAELYTPKPASLDLDHHRRFSFFEDIGAGMPHLSALGVEAIAFPNGRDQNLPCITTVLCSLGAFPMTQSSMLFWMA